MGMEKFANLGAAGSIALDLAPEIGRWLFGADAGPTVAAVAGAVAGVTGTSDPAAQLAALQDPAATGRLRVQLAAIAARAAASDASAPMPGSPLSWGAPLVSVVVLLTFGTVVVLAMFHEVPARSEALMNVMLGTLAAMATSIVGYWVGSSVGSARKDDRLARLER